MGCPFPVRRCTLALRLGAPHCASARTTPRCPAPWRSPARLPPAFPGLRFRPAPTGDQLVPSSRSCCFLFFGLPLVGGEDFYPPALMARARFWRHLFQRRRNQKAWPCTIGPIGKGTAI